MCTPAHAYQMDNLAIREEEYSEVTPCIFTAHHALDKIIRWIEYTMTRRDNDETPFYL